VNPCPNVVLLGVAIVFTARAVTQLKSPLPTCQYVPCTPLFHSK
jgi:hypothetical protein